MLPLRLLLPCHIMESRQQHLLFQGETVDRALADVSPRRDRLVCLLSAVRCLCWPLLAFVCEGCEELGGFVRLFQKNGGGGGGGGLGFHVHGCRIV